MATPTNLGFETAGAVPGLAASWNVRGRFSALEVMGVGPTATLTPIAAPNDFTAGTWTATALTAGANAGNDPDGNATADSLTETVANSAHMIEGAAVAMASGARYGLACWLKRTSRDFAGVAWGMGGGNETSALVDLVNKRVTAVELAGSIAKASATVMELGSTGWLLVTLYIETSALIASIKPAVVLSSDGSTLSYVGDAAKSILAWGATIWDEQRQDVEAFERGWSNDGFISVLTIPTSSVPSTFTTSFPDPEAFEAFESAWGNYPFYTEVPAPVASTYDTTPQAFEDFEEEWNNVPFLLTIAGGVVAVFDTGAETHEDFEEEWLSSAFITVLSAPTVATFDGDLSENFEDFEEVIRDKTYTVNPATDVFTSNGHGLANNQTVYALVPSGGEMPEGLNSTVRYFVIASAANTFQLSLTQGGAAVDVTTTGVGTLQLRGDPARYWTEADYNTSF